MTPAQRAEVIRVAKEWLRTPTGGLRLVASGVGCKQIASIRNKGQRRVESKKWGRRIKMFSPL